MRIVVRIVIELVNDTQIYSVTFFYTFLLELSLLRNPLLIRELKTGPFTLEQSPLQKHLEPPSPSQFLIRARCCGKSSQFLSSPFPYIKSGFPSPFPIIESDPYALDHELGPAALANQISRF
jgi:hypothetical protein